MRTLAARLARGDESAFAELYDTCADRLHRYVALRLGSREAASDVVQAAFLRAVKSRRRFHDVENPVAYLFQIARNEASRASRSHRRQNQQTPMIEEILIADDESATAIDDAEAASEALARLAANDREIVELKLYAGLTFREIAEITAQPPGTVATRYRRALKSLRAWLEKQTK